MERATNQAAVELIDKLGGLTVVAQAAGVSRQAVFKWRTHGFPPARIAVLKEAFPRVGFLRATGRGRTSR